MATTLPETDELSRLRLSAHDRGLAIDLGRRVAPAIDNQRLHAEARQAHGAKDDFLATLSHERRTPVFARAAAALFEEDTVR